MGKGMGCRVGGTVSLKRHRSMLGRVLVWGLILVVYSMVCSTSPVLLTLPHTKKTS